MQVINIRDLMRNDCTMDLQCDHCGHKQEDKSAYNDNYYIHTVVPVERYCKKCQKNAAGKTKPTT